MTDKRETPMSETVPSEAAKAALRDSVATWEEVTDELVWENYDENDPDDKPIPPARLEWFCKRFPHFDERLRDYVKLWNASPRITDEMLAEVEVKPEDVDRSFMRVKQIMDFYYKHNRLKQELQSRDALIRELIGALEYWLPAFPENGDEREAKEHEKLILKAREVMNGS